MNEVLCQEWRDLLRVWRIASGDACRAFDDLSRHYAEPGRFYHTLDHVEDVLATIETLTSFATHPASVKLAGWLHDVIYDSRASDNEERSANYAEKLCERLTIPEGHRVAALILTTKTHDAGLDVDAQVLLDADLSILGADEPTYRDYAEKIRREFDWVPESQFRLGRRQVLERFLTRPRIFHFLTEREAPARRNIAAEIAELSRPAA